MIHDSDYGYEVMVVIPDDSDEIKRTDDQSFMAMLLFMPSIFSAS